MDSTDRDVDAILAAAGGRWRGAQPGPPEPDPARFAGGIVQDDDGRRWDRPRRRWLVPAAAVGAAVVVFAAIMVPVMLSRHGAGGSPVGGAPGVTYQVLPPDGGSGIAVVGVGTLLRDGPGDIHLCATVFATFDMPSSHAGCGPVAVRTTGVAGSWLTTQTTGGQAYSRRVRVVGVYHLGTLAVTSVAEASTDPTPLPANPPVPCPAPSGGWRPGTGFASSTDQMDPERRLSDYVAQRPDIFGASWVGYPANVPVGASAPTVSVRIIGTTGDLAQAHTELSAIYAGNLCVYRVERSKTDLQRIVDTLTSRSATPVEATPLETENRVQVTVVALDGPMDTLLTQIGRDAVQLEPPLLRAP